MNHSALNRAFKELRKMGFLARQNFLCCNTCGDSASATQAEKLIDKDAANRDKIKGTVFYHKQATQSMNKGCDLFVNYGQLDTCRFGAIGISDLLVGKTACEVFRKHGLNVIWDGDTARKIQIVNE
jgi:hypothetical protein